MAPGDNSRRHELRHRKAEDDLSHKEKSMNLALHFSELLAAAAAQSQPHRLLFVFAAASLPDDPTPEQTGRFHRGGGGVLEPVMCVDKAPGDLADFSALVRESRQAGPSWDVVFATSLSGEGGRPPVSSRVDLALQTMVEAVRTGRFQSFAAYNAQGEFLSIG